MHELSSLDLCTGIFGLGLAAEAAGFQTRAVAETNAFCRRFLSQRLPGVPNLGDIRKADFRPYRGIDLVTAGYPCQPYALPGLRLGKRDDRHVWPAVLEALKVTRAPWFVGENVAGHISLGLDEVLSDLEAASYAPRAFVIPACAVWAMHRRDRVVVVAYLDRRIGRPRGRRLKPGADAHRRATSAPHAYLAGWQEQHLAEVAALQKVADRRSLAQWLQGCAEPPVVRRLHGIPRRVDRIKALGNAVYPPLFFVVLKAIAEIQTELMT